MEFLVMIGITDHRNALIILGIITLTAIIALRKPVWSMLNKSNQQDTTSKRSGDVGNV